MLLLFLWLGPQQSLPNVATSSGLPQLSTSGTPGSLPVGQPGSQQATANHTPPGQAKNASPTPAPSFPILPSLPPGYSPSPTPVATPTPTAAPTASPTPSAGPTPTPATTTASFGYSPASPVTGQLVTFDGTASNCAAFPCSYKWTDDGCPSPCGDLGTGLTLIFSFANVGTKYIRLTVIDALAYSATVEHNVAVGAAPIPTPTPAPSPAPAPSPTPPPTPPPPPTPTPPPPTPAAPLGHTPAGADSCPVATF